MDADRKLAFRVLLFCFAAVAACYANSLYNDFILDDVFIVATNPDIRTIQPVRYFSTPFWGEDTDLGIYRPLVILSFSLEYSLWQRWAPGFRLVNLLLHAINGLLVFLLARSLFATVTPAWAAAGLYVVHPVHTEAVAGIAGRSELLAAMFFFLGWLLFRQRRMGWCVAAFSLSLLSKENAISFPAVIALDIWISKGQVKAILLEWKRLAVLAAAAVMYFGLRLWVLGASALTPPEYLNGAWTFIERELTSARAFLRYFGLVLAPVDVTGDYGFNSIPIANAADWDAWLGALLILTTLILAIRISRRDPVIALGVLFFYVTLLPVSNWIVPTGLVMAERYLYVPVFGASLIAGALWTRIRSGEARKILAAGVLAVSALLCVSHNYIWQDNFTFYRNMARVLPDNARARSGYGIALLDAGRVDEAQVQFEAGLRIARNAPMLLGLAGVSIQTDQNCSRAHPLIDEALIAEPGESSAYWLRAECREIEGSLSEAAESYRRAVELTRFPDSRLLFDWGMLMEKMGRKSEAAALYERASTIDPGDLSIRYKSRTASQAP